MKNMLKVTVSVLAMCSFTTVLKAQTEMTPFKIGVKAGLNVANFSHSGYDSRAGFHVGADAMFDMTHVLDNTYLRANFLLTQVGSKIAVNGSDWKFNPLYLQVPVRFGYGYVVTPGTALFLETGPYMALGIAGKERYEGYKADFFDDARRFDMGWGLHGGVILDKTHQISIGYDWGFIDSHDRFDQNRNLMLSYTYFFK